MDITIEQGDDYAVEVEGSRDDANRYRVYTSGSTLVADYNDKGSRRGFWKGRDFDNHEISLRIIMPRLREIEARGGGKLRFRGFEEEKMDVDLTGAVMANAGIDVRNLKIEITGASSLDLAGTGSYLDADITGASVLSAYGYEVKDANIQAHGASTAKVFVTEKLAHN